MMLFILIKYHILLGLYTKNSTKSKVKLLKSSTKSKVKRDKTSTKSKVKQILVDYTSLDNVQWILRAEKKRLLASSFKSLDFRIDYYIVIK